jgi:5-methylcytosine-specific restriction protein A
MSAPYGVIASNIQHEVQGGLSLEIALAEADDLSAFEGKVLAASHLRRERNTKIVQAAKSARLLKGRLRCDACAFDFEKVYGERGSQVIEAHHNIPLSDANYSGRKVLATDFAMLCANCHRMIHRFRPWLSIEELIELVPDQVRISNTMR